ncbi:MAG: glycoside hydrolase [Acidobacteriota bacterium]
MRASSDSLPIPDQGWNVWLDRTAAWEDDELFLPDEVVLSNLPQHAPSGGWQALYGRSGGADFWQVNLPMTVEEYAWGVAGARSYTPEEYRYAASDPVPQNGAYRGVFWCSRKIEIPSAAAGKRILLDVRAARMRAEVYLNEKLVGYSIMEELPFTCDLTEAARPGGVNRLALRITNPGGRYDWVDGSTIPWGKVKLYRSHGFGGLDRGLALRLVPRGGHITDLWVLNTPEPRTITAKTKLENGAGSKVRFEVIDPASGQIIASAEGVAAGPNAPDGAEVEVKIHVPNARIWDLDSPHLYQLRAIQSLPAGGQDTRRVSFGFRWYAPDGLGKNAIFRLNGRRIKIYTAISWGYWGHNGLFPTPELAEREVRQAKRLRLNCLNFHRNVGKEEVFDAHDRLGLLRYMEPGGGRLSIGKLPTHAASNSAGVVMDAATDPADQFSQRFMLEKCRYMVRAFRSHPSLIQYTLQNELGADLKNPASFAAIDIMHAEDPSRLVVLNDGFVARGAAQAWYEPYNNQVHRSDREAWGGWWNNHQGAGDQWYDRFYQDPERFTYRQPLKEALVEFGEMEGCAVADNHPVMIHQIETRQLGGSGSSYDLADHREIAAAYDRFLDRWGFRQAFPTSSDLFRSLGDKCYASWQQYLENIRICDEVDFAAISGWESTAIENHSGIVDNLRNFKGDPDFIASSLLPIRPVLKQHALCSAVGEQAAFDLFLVNETGRMPEGKLRLEMFDPGKQRTALGTWEIPPAAPDQFSYSIAAGFNSPVLHKEGIYRFVLHCDGAPAASCEREIWVADAQLRQPRKLRVGVSGVLPALHEQLNRLPDLEVVPFHAGDKVDVVVACGVLPDSKLKRNIGDETGLEPVPGKGAKQEPRVLGELAAEVIAAVKAGTPLLAAVPDDDLADGVARQLAALNAFAYRGQVGDLRAPWMGNWLFVRAHATFAGLPVNRALGIHYQAPGKQSNGLLIDRAPIGAEPEVILGYSRDHDRNIGAASFVCRVGKTPVLVHRAPAFSAPLQARWLANALRYLGQGESQNSKES